MRNINAHNKHVAVELVGYLLEELRDASNFKALQADVASANIFVGSLIFIEELADKVSGRKSILRVQHRRAVAQCGISRAAVSPGCLHK